MGNVVWKYELVVKDEPQSVEIPTTFRWLSAARQHMGPDIMRDRARQHPGYLAAWALVDADAPQQKRYLMVVGTGHRHERLAESAYIGTIQDGPFVWHVFDVTGTPGLVP